MELESVWHELIKEGQETMVKKIAEFLNGSYEPKTGVLRTFGEYDTKPTIINKIDGEALEPENVFLYLKRKFPTLSEDFLKQVMLDWYNGKFKTEKYTLSKTVAM